MTPEAPPARSRPPLSAVLSRLRTVLQQQADALSAEDFDTLDRLDPRREQLVAALVSYTASDRLPGDREIIEQVGALDRQLVGMVRESLERTGQELREVRRGRSAMHQYQQRGQATIRGLATLDVER